jgi:hypothetical protein
MTSRTREKFLYLLSPIGLLALWEAFVAQS